ncbi:unnamed protein product [Ophioblennius macclurei]
MRIQVVCLLLLMVLLVLPAASFLALDEKPNPAYKRFNKKHVIEQMRAADCDKVMRKRGIYAMKGRKKACKSLNTFILAGKDEVKSVCENGKPQEDFIKSKTSFNLVACNLTSEETGYPKCSYDGEKLQKKILIKCANGFPVHFEGDIKYCDA